MYKSSKSTQDGIGFVAASPDTNFHETVRGLGDRLSLPFLGGTTLGNPFDASGEAFGSSIGLLDRKGVRSAVVLSDPVAVDRDNSVELANELHSRAVRDLGVDPKLFIIFVPITPNLFADHLITALYAAAGSVPVFGGMVSDDFNAGRSSVFFDGECHSDRIALAALGGDIDPVFAVGLELTYPSKYSPIITDGGGNVIRRVDDMIFAEFLKKYDIDASAIEEFPVSIRLSDPRDADGGHAFIADLVKLEPDGSGVFAHTVRPGAAVTLSCLTRENIENSARGCIDRLRMRMREKEEAGREFGMIFAASCVARYFVIAREQRNVEAELLAKGLPEGLPTFGMFAFAEYSPAHAPDGTRANAIHSQTLALCAF